MNSISKYAGDFRWNLSWSLNAKFQSVLDVRRKGPQGKGGGDQPPPPPYGILFKWVCHHLHQNKKAGERTKRTKSRAYGTVEKGKIWVYGRSCYNSKLSKLRILRTGVSVKMGVVTAAHTCITDTCEYPPPPPICLGENLDFVMKNLMFCVDKVKYEHLAILSNLKTANLHLK